MRTLTCTSMQVMNDEFLRRGYKTPEEGLLTAVLTFKRGSTDESGVFLMVWSMCTARVDS